MEMIERPVLEWGQGSGLSSYGIDIDDEDFVQGAVSGSH